MPSQTSVSNAHGHRRPLSEEGPSLAIHAAAGSPAGVTPSAMPAAPLPPAQTSTEFFAPSEPLSLDVFAARFGLEASITEILKAAGYTSTDTFQGWLTHQEIREDIELNKPQANKFRNVLARWRKGQPCSLPAAAA